MCVWLKNALKSWYSLNKQRLTFLKPFLIGFEIMAYVILRDPSGATFLDQNEAFTDVRPEQLYSFYTVSFPDYKHRNILIK